MDELKRHFIGSLNHHMIQIIYIGALYFSNLSTIWIRFFFFFYCYKKNAIFDLLSWKDFNIIVEYNKFSERPAKWWKAFCPPPPPSRKFKFLYEILFYSTARRSKNYFETRTTKFSQKRHARFHFTFSLIPLFNISGDLSDVPVRLLHHF